MKDHNLADLIAPSGELPSLGDVARAVQISPRLRAVQERLDELRQQREMAWSARKASCIAAHQQQLRPRAETAAEIDRLGVEIKRIEVEIGKARQERAELYVAHRRAIVAAVAPLRAEAARRALLAIAELRAIVAAFDEVDDEFARFGQPPSDGFSILPAAALARAEVRFKRAAASGGELA